MPIKSLIAIGAGRDGRVGRGGSLKQNGFLTPPLLVFRLTGQGRSIATRI